MQVAAEDQVELRNIRTQLTNLRQGSRVSQKQVERRIGIFNFIKHAEEDRYPYPRLSTLQQWAAAYDLRLEVGLDNFWLHAWSDKEMLALYAMSRRFDAAPMLRLWVVSALRSWRQKVGVDSARLGGMLGITGTAVRTWEYESGDPGVDKVLIRARLLGTRVRVRLWSREDWIFE